jgi:hypothetical protein
MNKNKRPMTKRLQKKMAKEIRNAQGRYPVPESRQYSDELTDKEMLKKYPKRKAAKYGETLESARKEILIKKKVQHANESKRTTPSFVPSDSSPAHIHEEGKRWMKTLVKQNIAERKILTHKGTGVGRKK